MPSISSSSEPVYNVASVKLCTGALGPYRRMAIWFQGCLFGCPGCCNPELQLLEARHLVGLSELLEAARRSMAENGIEGVTFIGGEPTLQKDLPALAEGLRGLGLGIVMFTGRLYEELPEDLKRNIDLVVDGRFEAENRDPVRNLVGSRNQRIVDVSGRYAGDLGWFTETRPDFIEVDVSDDYFITNGSAF